MLFHTIAEVREQIKNWKRQGLTVGLVPTMGALHDGHLSLIKKSVEKCDRTVISIFVNPIQFCPGEDFEKYPRTLDADRKLAEDAGVDVVFAPSAEEMYGAGHIMSSDFLTYVIPPFFYQDKLCGKSRVGHFDGVCTVVNKLFNIVQPDYAFFGEKDRQQLIIIQKMVKDLSIPVEIIPCPIVREEDGLAMSSRNRYLSPEERKEALVLKSILFNIKSCYNSGIKEVSALTETAYSYLKACNSLEYLEFRDKNDLEVKKEADNETIVFIALKIGSVRLIDNISLG
ncbi:pantoate--beta-alanine ligase [bacterium]|nr:pantoate--beta-alanine ligase [bacterium]